ncbi:MAG: toxin-antitoxin system HicB family antitoxin [Spirochaetae bacterium HGW-Spirochaetae-4]|nr:MAG: toxin-antitoxin system HicB family antitoxin [Spirochaetae bacterium HGW-Spirochaetae-4]HCS35203.1 toxin-antitoxin system HicB family antitoxin [Sphaerochaeta sp.]
MKSLEDYLKLPYTIETRRESDGSYFIKVKELPGCMSVGESIGEAYAMIEDAKADWIQSCLDDGCVVPEPEEEDVKTYSGKFMVRISPKLHRELSETAEKHGVSLNHLVTEMLSQENGILKSQQRTIDQLLGKVSPIPVMTGEGRIAFDMPSAVGRWTPLATNTRPSAGPVLIGKVRKSRKTGTR